MKIGILGAGNIAKKMAYTLSQMEDADCVAVGARELSRAEAFAQQFGIQKAYGSYEELLQDKEIELIYVATPHSHHAEHMKLCLTYGKHVICEKPFTVNAKQAKEVLELAKQKNLFVTEAMWTKYMPSHTMIETVIAEGKIGTINFATANLGYDIQHKPRLTNPDLAGGALLDVGIYPLTFLSMVLGTDIKQITSHCVKTETGVDAVNAITLVYHNGTMGMAHSSMMGATEQWGIVYGTKGYLVAENINNVDKICIYDNNRNKIEEQQVPPQITGFEYEIRASIHAIRQGNIYCKEHTHEDILQMIQLMDDIRTQWDMKYPFE